MHHKVGFMFICLFIAAALGCSRRMGEKEYYDLANQYMRQQDWVKAEQYFEKILQEYPNGVLSSNALFMVGFLNANHLNNLEKARKYYEKFIEKYPNHELADDAQYELQNLGKDIEELPFLKGESGTEERKENKISQETIKVD